MELLREDYKSIIGKQIQECRDSVGISQEALAAIVGVSVTSISKIERGVCVLTMENFVRIANALDTSADNLLSGVVSAAYKSKVSFLSEKFSTLSPKEQVKILRVIETMMDDIAL